MRLASLTLERYGPFEHLTLPLDPAPGRVNLIVAPNGYGKSVMRQAIGDLLFGIPERSPMSFQHGTERMRLVAEVADGERTRCLVRRKGRGNTLADVDGEPVSVDEARRLLGGADEALFRQLFGLDTALLREGAEVLLKSEGRLGQVLFAASGGMGRVRALLERLRERRDELGSAGRRHKSRPLWAAFEAYGEAQRALTRAALRPDAWHRLEREASAAEARLAGLRVEQADGNAAIRQRRMVQAVRPWLARYENARAVLDATGDVPRLDADFERRWRDALIRVSQTASVASAAAAAAEAAQAGFDAITVDARWLAAEAEIAALSELRGRAQGATTDRGAVVEEQARHAEEAAQLRRDLGWEEAVSVPPAPAIRVAQQRLRARPSLQATAETATRSAEEAAGRLERTRATLAALATDADSTAIADLLAALGGDPVARLQEAQRRLREAEAALATALAAIPDRPLSETGLQATAAPSEAALETAAAALSDAGAASRQARAELDNIAAEQGKLSAELSRLNRRVALPEPGALASARAKRDEIWSALQPALRGGAFDPGWPLAFERALRDADTTADALIAHNTEAARAAELRQRIMELQGRERHAGGAVAGCAGRLQAARAQLDEIARTAGGAAGMTLPTLRSFLRARLDATFRRAERDRARADAADLRAGLDALGARLAEALGLPPPPPEALAPLLAEATRRVALSRALVARRAQLADDLHEQVEQHAARGAAAAEANAALADWSAEWATMTRALARPPDESPDAAAESLALIERLRAADAKHRDAVRRIADMDAAIARLVERVAALSARLAPSLAGVPPIEAAAALSERLRAEREAAARKQELQRQAALARIAAQAAAADATAAGTALAALRAALRVEDDEAAEQQLARARHVTEAVAKLAEAEAQLATQGGGRDIPALTALVLAATPEAEAAEIDRLEARQQELAPLIEAAVTERDRAAEARDQTARSSEAADAAARRAGAQAALARNAEEALVLHAAAMLLQAALERQAAAADQPLLARIGDAFRAITAGAYAGVAVEADGRGQAMVALTADGTGRKPLDQLSEGTRDQLYLALRIAALEDYAVLAPPLPFIADDVLQTFDDTRTVATLDALRALSEHVQVIALTHHPHVAGLAEALPAGAVHRISLV